VSIKSRLCALERRASSGGYIAETCPQCGRPDPKGPSVLVLDATEGEKARECSRCGRLLDKSGRPLGPHGQVILVRDDDGSQERVYDQDASRDDR